MTALAAVLGAGSALLVVLVVFLRASLFPELTADPTPEGGQLQPLDCVLPTSDLIRAEFPSSTTFRHLSYPSAPHEQHLPVVWSDEHQRCRLSASVSPSAAVLSSVVEQAIVRRPVVGSLPARPWLFCHLQHDSGLYAGFVNLMFAAAHCIALAHVLRYDVALSGFHPRADQRTSVRMSSVLDYPQLQTQLRALDVHLRIADRKPAWDYAPSRPYMDVDVRLLASAPRGLASQLDRAVLERAAPIPDPACGDCAVCPVGLCNESVSVESPFTLDGAWVDALEWYLYRPHEPHSFFPWSRGVILHRPLYSVRQQQLVVAMMRDLPFTAVWQQRAVVEQLRLGLYGRAYYAVHLRVESDYDEYVTRQERKLGLYHWESWASRAITAVLQLMERTLPNRSMPLFVATYLSSDDPLYRRVASVYPHAVRAAPGLQYDEDGVVRFLVASEAVGFVGIYSSSFSHAMHNRHVQLGHPAALLPTNRLMDTPSYDMPPPHQQPPQPG